MSNERMSEDEVLATLGRAADCVNPMNSPQHAEWHAELVHARKAVAALIAEHNEDQGVIAVWRGRCERAEAERDALIAERDAFRKALQEIVKNDPHRMSSAGLIAREALDTDDQS